MHKCIKSAFEMKKGVKVDFLKVGMSNFYIGYLCVWK